MLLLSFLAISSAWRSRFPCFSAFFFNTSVRPCFVPEGVIRVERRGGALFDSPPFSPFPDPGVVIFFTGLFPGRATSRLHFVSFARFDSEGDFPASRPELASDALVAAADRCPRVITLT